MKIGFIVEGFNDEKSLKEIYPEALFAVTKGTRFNKRVKMDIKELMDKCDHVFSMMDPDEPGERMTAKIQENFWGVPAIVIEEEEAVAYRNNFQKRKIGVEHCGPDYLKKVIDKAIEDEKYKHLEGYGLVSAKIADGYYKDNSSLRRFEEDLYKAFDVENNPKREKCFSLAWEHGHSAGYHEVLNYFSEFVELIQ